MPWSCPIHCSRQQPPPGQRRCPLLPAAQETPDEALQRWLPPAPCDAPTPTEIGPGGQTERRDQFQDIIFLDCIWCYCFCCCRRCRHCCCCSDHKTLQKALHIIHIYIHIYTYACASVVRSDRPCLFKRNRWLHSTKSNMIFPDVQNAD